MSVRGSLRFAFARRVIDRHAGNVGNNPIEKKYERAYFVLSHPHRIGLIAVDVRYRLQLPMRQLQELLAPARVADKQGQASLSKIPACRAISPCQFYSPHGIKCHKYPTQVSSELCSAP